MKVGLQIILGFWQIGQLFFFIGLKIPI